MPAIKRRRASTARKIKGSAQKPKRRTLATAKSRNTRTKALKRKRATTAR